MVGLCLRVQRGNADAASDANHTLLVGVLKGVSQGSHHIHDAVTHTQGFELPRGDADHREVDGNGAVRHVEIGDGQGKTLPRLVHPQHDELSWLRGRRDVLRLDAHPDDATL